MLMFYWNYVKDPANKIGLDISIEFIRMNSEQFDNDLLMFIGKDFSYLAHKSK